MSVPIANATAAIAAFVVLLVIVLVIGGVIALITRGRKRHAELHPEEPSSPDAQTVEVEPNIGGIGLAIAAATLAVVSVFLPALEASAFSRIEGNTMIQSGTGWLIIGCAVGVFGAAYRVYSKRTTTWSVFFLGLVILGGAVYTGTGSRTELHSVASFGGRTLTVNGSPAVGLYAAGAAGVLAMFAGLILAGHVADSYRGAQRRTKACPDCAETVLAEARVCKHCGHQFELAGDADQLRALARKLGLAEDDPNVLRNLREVQAAEDRPESP